MTIDLNLTEKVWCYRCDGRGQIVDTTEKLKSGREKVSYLPCLICGGTGEEERPTNFGQSILEFIKKYKDILE